MTFILGLDHLQLAMPEGGEAAARQFYVDVLGFQEIAKPPLLAQRGGAWFQTGQLSVHLGVDRPFTPAKKAHPAFRCREYAEFLLHLATCGVQIVPDNVPFAGCAHCYIADPFGNRIEFIAERADG